MNSSKRLLAIIAALLLPVGGAALSACDGTAAVAGADTFGPDASGPPSLQTVSTTLSETSIVAGGSTIVTCTGRDQYEDVIDVPMSFRVIDPSGNSPEGVTVSGQTITAAFAGSFRVICQHEGTPAFSDNAPPTLAVQAGAPAEIFTYVLFNTVTAGTRISVACSVRDAAGNRTAAETMIRVTPPEGATVEGSSVLFEKTGDYAVACTTVDGGLATSEPPSIKVTPGELATLVTILSTPTISPGGSVTVTCPGRDRFGNTVPLEKVITAPVDGLTGQDNRRLSLSGTRAGLYSVTCIPQEAWVKAASASAQLEILAGAPAGLTLGLSPDRAVYPVGMRVLLTPVVLDSWGNSVTNIDDEIALEALFNNRLQQTLTPGSRATLDAEGFWVLRARLGPPYNLSAQRSVAADASAPIIDITNPVRGQMVTASGSSMPITGEVRDLTGGLFEVTIDGATQTLTQGVTTFPIARTYLPEHGMNSIIATALDVTDNFTRAAQSWLAAPEWKPAASSFDEGIIAFLSRDFIDDGVRTGAANDLATIFERVVGNINVSSLLPSPAVTYGGFDVYLRNMRYNKPTIALSPGLNGLLLEMNVQNIAVDVDAQGFVNVGGKVTVSSVDIDMMLSITVVNGVARVRQEATTVNVNGLRIDVHWSINWLVNLFSNTISNALSDSLKTALVQMVPPMLQDVFKSIELNETFTVPAFFPGMQPLNVLLSSKLYNAAINESGITLGLRTRASAARRVTWATRGSIMRGGCFGVDGGPPVWNPAKRIGAAISLDVINQLLHAVWQGGGLELTMGADAFGGANLEADFGITALDIDMSARLPPLLTDCGGKLVLQMAEINMDVHATLSGVQLNVSLIIAVETGAVVEMKNGKLTMSLESIPEEAILVDITSIESDLFDTNLEVELIDFLRDLVLVKALEQVGGQTLADFPLPEIDLGAIDPSLSGTVISFTNSELTRKRGFLTLGTNP